MFIAVFAWVLHAIVLAYLLPRIYLESRMRFREIAVSTTIGAVVGLSVTALLLAMLAPGYSIVGAVLGESGGRRRDLVAGGAAAVPRGRESRRGAPSVGASHAEGLRGGAARHDQRCLFAACAAVARAEAECARAHASRRATPASARWSERRSRAARGPVHAALSHGRGATRARGPRSPHT